MIHYWILIVQQITCSLVIVLLALCHPYKKKYINYIDILIIADLAILNSLSIFLLEDFKESEELEPPFYVFALQIILMFLPLIIVVGFIVLKYAKRWLHPRKWWQKNREQFDVSGAAHQLPNVTESQNETEAFLARAEIVNRYKAKATTSVVSVNGSSHWEREEPAEPDHVLPVDANGLEKSPLLIS